MKIGPKAKACRSANMVFRLCKLQLVRYLGGREDDRWTWFDVYLPQFRYHLLIPLFMSTLV